MFIFSTSKAINLRLLPFTTLLNNTSSYVKDITSSENSIKGTALKPKIILEILINQFINKGYRNSSLIQRFCP